MDSTYLLQQIVNGIGLGSIYALVAIGFSITYSILRLINFAHGDILMIGSYCALFIFLSGKVPLVVGLLLAMGFAALIGMLVERIAYRPLRTASEESMLITSIALSILIENLGILTVSAQPRKFVFPEVFAKNHELAGVTFNNMTILTVGVAVLLMILLTFFVKNTRLGTAMRACSENIGVARLMGIDINIVVAIAFAIGSALAAVAGIMLGGQYGRIDPLMGFIPGLKAFVAAVIGGIGSIPGAVLGGYLLGLFEILLVGFLPIEYTGYRDAFVFILLILVLLLRPNGILGSAEGRKV
ncbi:branched-chain amino acid ABC transporter permease [Desulforamulus aeronauticus]|uniref:Branched-chain amino acid transport system permease protein n=1 Tax=Desulforamulus aeronauticus DSM 10349 TaxID=1121421 RepID=A0A1M6NNH8_9FIRM|nr:branched-chain amino acid ABC transporter permease [Desulforamulus aeronauticus]SHJ97245.1 branched-chain amino acid transport system permease protein [Desulforamulus aeronauticus DSM 10349]